MRSERLFLTRAFAAHPATSRLWRFALVSLTAVFAVEGIVIVGPEFVHAGTLGVDFGIYLDRARSWMAGDGFYLPSQLSGPYVLGSDVMPPLYPPTLLYLLVPFTVLPAILWWAIPVGVIGFSLYRLRPAIWTWPILAVVLCYSRTWIALGYGNPSLWAFAALAAGLVWTWPLALIPIKPTLAPFALLGVRRRAFWVGVGAFLLLSLPFGSMWIDYFTVMLNTRNELGLAYPVGEWPIAAAFVIAYLGRQRREPAEL